MIFTGVRYVEQNVRQDEHNVRQDEQCDPCHKVTKDGLATPTVEHLFETDYRRVMAGETPRETESDTPHDAPVYYRADGYGGRLAILPATCRRLLHQLGATGYRATEGGGVVRVRCDACASETATDAAWILRTSGPVANRAELDDTPYRALLASLVSPVSR